jgi:3-methyl-2-oxobutanoate hydroxymethyltransferase
MAANSSVKKTVTHLRQQKSQGRKIVMVTAYDATFARLVDEAGVDMVLVGDSLGMVVQGHDNTLPVTLDDMIYHSRAVSRGLKSAHLTVDLPFMTYQLGPEQALESAGRLVKEGHAESVKLEGGQRVAESVRRIVQAGIPVVGHVGLTPQSVHAMGGFKVQGRDHDDAQDILEDARVLEEAGCFCLVLEGIPSELARTISRSVSIPTVGIGAGPGCDGQVLVIYDLLGAAQDFNPKFLKKYANLHEVVVGAVAQYSQEVRLGQFPTEEHAFKGTPTPVPLYRKPGVKK